VDAGVRIGVLDSEGGVFPNLETYGQMASPQMDVYQRVSCFCSWGPKLADYLKAQGWFRESQLAVTGSPRFDFYAEPWRAAALRCSPLVDRYPRPIILINGSFPRANPCFQTPDQEIQSWAALGFEREYMLRYQRVESQALREMAALANHVAARFPKATVIYRPHPFEKLATYEPLLDRRNNLHLVKLGTVEGWILRAAAMINRNSTTAVEAAVAGVPVLLPGWIEVGEQFEAVEAVSTRCETVDELDARLDACLSDPHARNVRLESAAQRIVHDFFFTLDGSAHERVASRILSHVNGGGRVNAAACKRIHYGWQDPSLTMKSRVGIALRMALGFPASWSFGEWAHRDPATKWESSEKRFDVETVRAFTGALGAASEVRVDRAEPKHDYRFGYRWGRSVVMRPN
jgi:surface carbohydrate biosynthesis protein